MVGDQREVGVEQALQPRPLARADPARVGLPEQAVVDDQHLRARVGRPPEQLERRADAGRDPGHLVGAGHLQADRQGVRVGVGLQQSVCEGDDLVSAGHARTVPPKRVVPPPHPLRAGGRVRNASCGWRSACRSRAAWRGTCRRRPGRCAGRRSTRPTRRPAPADPGPDRPRGRDLRGRPAPVRHRGRRPAAVAAADDGVRRLLRPPRRDAARAGGRPRRLCDNPRSPGRGAAW